MQKFLHFLKKIGVFRSGELWRRFVCAEWVILTAVEVALRFDFLAVLTNFGYCFNKFRIILEKIEKV